MPAAATALAAPAALAMIAPAAEELGGLGLIRRRRRLRGGGLGAGHGRAGHGRGGLGDRHPAERDRGDGEDQEAGSADHRLNSIGSGWRTVAPCQKG